MGFIDCFIYSIRFMDDTSYICVLQTNEMECPSSRGRYSHVVIWIVILGASYFLIYTQLIIWTNTTDIIILFAILTQITALIYPFLISYRAWMIYFKIKWNVAVEDTEWHIFVDVNSKNKNFYLKYYAFNK
eukprot:265117_1